MHVVPKVGISSWFLFATVLAPCQGSQQLETPADASNSWCNLHQKSQREHNPIFRYTSAKEELQKKRIKLPQEDLLEVRLCSEKGVQCVLEAVFM